MNRQLNRPQDAVAPLEGCELTVSGQVQGVGFRPFVHQLAHALGLAGDVRNDARGVRMRLWGAPAVLDEFERRLLDQAPPMALIDALARRPLVAETAAPGEFRILASCAGEVRVGVTPDATVCPACLEELFDPLDRRYRYPFINCTHCGPRYSLIRKLPYDRPHTTMAAFELCPVCSREYENPADRRFHAQPTACPSCGPRLALHETAGPLIEVADPIAETLNRIGQGQVVAIKGVGGFHLVCDARNSDAVAQLRRRKGRQSKPFAVMGANPASLAPWVTLNVARIAQLQSSVAPILLCPARHPDALGGIAPGLPWLGVMLPHSPLHYLLFHQAAGAPSGCHWLDQAQELLLVMTSANPGGEPLVTANEEAFRRLGGLADAILLHDRDIHIRCDDSVVHGGGAGESAPLALIRRGRGLAPRVIPLPAKWAGAPSVLATGAALKNTVCLTQGDRAYVSQHIGDLASPGCCRALEQTVDHLCALFEITPRWVVHDLHPDNFATRFAQEFARGRGLTNLAVQHHQAHLAAVLAEHGLGASPVLGLALDGFGLGDDGTGWGGELLRLEGARYQRLGQLASLPLPGGDRAATEPWRMAAAVLHRLGRSDEIVKRFPDQPAAGTVVQMLRGSINSPLTSSAGRLFDAAAGILGIQPVADYEAQPAMMLEGRAQGWLESNPGKGAGDESPLIELTHRGDLNPLPLLAHLLERQDRGLAVGQSAALLHSQLIDALARWVEHHNRHQGLDTLVLGGGCFLNQLLNDGLRRRLRQRGLRVLSATKLPCNDGGLSLGQAWLGLSTLEEAGMI